MQCVSSSEVHYLKYKMRWQKLFTALTLVYSVTAQTARPKPPVVRPSEKGRPKNMRYCLINANTLFPWVVGVWDIGFKQYVGLGSMITYIAFVTSCRQYTAPHTAYKAVGQFLWNLSLPEEPCMQEKLLSAIYKHPKCLSSPKEATFFDYAVMRLKYAFDISGPNYPTVPFASSPSELLAGIQYVNIVPNTTGCMLPYFRDQNEQPPVFDFEAFVESITFRSSCVKLLCEKIPPNPAFSRMCEARFGNRARATMLCMKNKDGQHIHLGVGNTYWYAGTPLVCNGTAYGIATQAKDRKHFPYPRWDDIHFVVTFLRVWPWLIGLVKEHAVPWVRPVFIDARNLRAEEIPVTKRVPIDSEDTIQPRSDAVVCGPSFKIMIFMLHFYCFYAKT